MELLEEPHNAEYLSKVLDHVLRSFEVENKIQTYVFIFLNSSINFLYFINFDFLNYLFINFI